MFGYKIVKKTVLSELENSRQEVEYLNETILQQDRLIDKLTADIRLLKTPAVNYAAAPEQKPRKNSKKK
jgi:hypothetical protein